MLTRIDRISESAVFRDFRWHDLTDFGTYNLLFGANGSGKSTISKALASIGKDSSPPGRMTLTFSDRTQLTLPANTASPFPLSVFNADYISENLLYRAGAKAQALYYIGQASTAARVELDAAEATLETAQQAVTTSRTDAQTAQRALNSFGTDSARLIRTTLSALGDTRYSRYERPNYFRAADELNETGPDNITLKANLDKDSLAARASASAMSPVARVPESLSEASNAVRTASSLVNRGFVLDGLDDLLASGGPTQWLADGTRLHMEIDYKECLFCGRTGFPLERRRLLERAFSQAFIDYQDSIRDHLALLATQLSLCEQFSTPDEGLLYEDLRANYRASTPALKQAVKGFETTIQEITELLEAARANPSPHPATSLSELPAYDTRAAAVNNIVDRHNDRCAHAEDDKKLAGTELEVHLVAVSLPNYRHLTRDKAKAEERLAVARDNLDAARNDVRLWRSRLRDSIAAAKGLEDDVQHYLGHDELQVAVSAEDDAFVITRNGEPADGLSEGEQTAIALLYFLRTLDHDDGNRKSDRIVVLDDPVSSLDGNSLLAASEYIQERTHGVKQLFVFTHNDQLFLDVMRWMTSVQPSATHLYMLNVARTSDGRASRIVPLDPMLEKYRSMYMFAFVEMYRYRYGGEDEFAVDVYRLPNMARRFLEQFCLHRFPSIRAGIGVAKDQFLSEGLEEVATRRLVNILHAESHGLREQDLGLGLFRHEELRNVVSDVLRLVELSDNRHYKSLEEIVLRLNPDLAS